MIIFTFEFDLKFYVLIEEEIADLLIYYFINQQDNYRALSLTTSYFSFLLNKCESLILFFIFFK
jgi:hypothetical protein